MYDPAQGVADILDSDNVGVKGGLGANDWGIFIGRMPETPDRAILVNVTGGRSPWPHLLLNFPSVQVMIRGQRENGYQEAWTKSVEARDAVLGIDAQAVGGDWWQGVTQLGDVGFVGFDENHRPLFTANFSIIVEPAAGTHRLPI